MSLMVSLVLKLKNLERLTSSERPKKVRKVMREFKKGKLTSGNSKKKVKNRKQLLQLLYLKQALARKGK